MANKHFFKILFAFILMLLGGIILLIIVNQLSGSDEVHGKNQSADTRVSE